MLFFSNSRPSDLADVKIWRFLLAKTSAISLSLTYPSTEFTVFLLTLLIFFNSVNYGLALNTQPVITWTIEYYRSSAINQYYFFGPQWVKHVPIVENCGEMEKKCAISNSSTAYTCLDQCGSVRVNIQHQLNGRFNCNLPVADWAWRDAARGTWDNPS